jgi:hypothetical protein
MESERERERERTHKRGREEGSERVILLVLKCLRGSHHLSY